MDEESNLIMKGIKWTTLEGARTLVQQGYATTDDFLTFVGYCGWDADQLRDELEQGNWYMVAADSETVLDELRKNDASDEILDAGLESWSLLMKMIGREDEIDDANEGFDDLMLKEWTRERCLFPPEDEGDDIIDKFISKATGAQSFGSDEIGVGSVLRSTAAAYNPFLLSDQEYHKCTLLIIQDDDQMSVGVILNLPTSSLVEIEFENTKSGLKSGFKLPERYGGRFSDDGDEDVLLWFHCNEDLKDENIGSPLGPKTSPIWAVTSDDAANAIATGKARAEDFIVSSGLSVWEKAPGGIAGGIKGDVNNNLFEIIDPDNVESVWDILVQQEAMSEETMDENLSLIDLAWTEGESGDDDGQEVSSAKVYNSEVTIAELADTALRKWVTTFLLDN